MPDRLLAGLGERGEHVRHDLQALVARVLPEVVRRAADAVLGALDVTALVHRHLDLDALVRGIALDAIVERAPPGRRSPSRGRPRSGRFPVRSSSRSRPHT